LLSAPVTPEGRPSEGLDAAGICEVVQTKHEPQGEVLRNRWPATTVMNKALTVPRSSRNG
jgi:hypothetical protein